MAEPEVPQQTSESGEVKEKEEGSAGARAPSGPNAAQLQKAEALFEEAQRKVASASSFFGKIFGWGECFFN